MNILLLGGTGILSAEICRLALEKKMDVTTVTRGRKKEFINEKASNIIADIRKEDVETLRSKINVKLYDVVVDFISYNSEQLQKSLDIVGKHCKQYIFISSATVYKEVCGIHEYVESDNIDNNKWDYCIKKTNCERLLSNGSWEFSYTIVRPYITYGKTRIPFQIIPLKYYTLINRIKNGKPILVVNKDTICTLTNVKDFAEGVIGLFNNASAFGEAVHITSEQRYSWEKVAKVLGDNIGMKPRLIEISIDFLKTISNPGFDIEELEGDKARNMIFNNSKITQMSPQYTGSISFEEGIKDSFAFFAKPEHQTVDYLWEGRIDRILHIFYKKSNMKDIVGDYGLKSNEEKIGVKNRIMYYIGRFECLYVLAKYGKRILK